MTLEGMDPTVKAPAPSYHSPDRFSRCKAFFTTSTANLFSVPNDFTSVTPQKGLKSNSWFSSTTASLPTTAKEKDDFNSKTGRRIASTPNGKLLNMTRQQPINGSSYMDSTNKDSGGSPFGSLHSLSSSSSSQRFRSCRRTYSSNSVKVRSVQVGPSSFTKVRMLGKGDVGKVYMVRQKDSGRLYAMKGNISLWMTFLYIPYLSFYSALQARNGETEQDQTGFGRTRNPYRI